MLTAENTFCTYSTTIDKQITAIVWGVKLEIQQLNETVPCFYMLFAAREPEYCGQKIYQKMISAFQPHLQDEGPFKSEYLCWKQGKTNSINNSALETFSNILGDVSRTESEAYTFEAAENCSLKLDPHSKNTSPDNKTLEEALLKYALKAGDLLTFVYEFPVLLLKTSLLWNNLHTKQFLIQDGYTTSLQSI